MTPRLHRIPSEEHDTTILVNPFSLLHLTPNKAMQRTGRVARGGCPPPAPTEPDLWISHPALRDAGVRATARIPASEPSLPQLSQFQPEFELHRGVDSGPPVPPPPFQCQEPLLREVRVVQGFLHCRAATQVPEASPAVVHRLPGLLWPASEFDESARNRSLPSPLLQQQRT